MMRLCYEKKVFGACFEFWKRNLIETSPLCAYIVKFVSDFSDFFIKDKMPEGPEIWQKSKKLHKYSNILI
jgi:hypothetical protein